MDQTLKVAVSRVEWQGTGHVLYVSSPPSAYARSRRPALTSARNAAKLAGVTSRCPRSGLLLSRMPPARPAEVVPTSTHWPPLPLLAALRHLTISVFPMFPLPPSGLARATAR